MNQSPLHNASSPSPVWTPNQSPPKKDSSAWILGMVVGAAIFAVGCGSGLLAGWFAGSANSIGNALADLDFDMLPADLQATIQHPEVLTANTPFDVVLSVADTGGVAQSIEDIDFLGSLCDAAEIKAVSPSTTSVTRSGGYIEFYYYQPIAPNQSTDFVFTITPKHAGTYEVLITIYDENYNSIELTHDFTITD